MSVISFRKCVTVNLGKCNYVRHAGELESKSKFKQPNCLNSGIASGSRGGHIHAGGQLVGKHIPRVPPKSSQGEGASALTPGSLLITVMFYQCGLSFSFG